MELSYSEFNLSNAIDKNGPKYIRNIKITRIAIRKLLGSLFMMNHLLPIKNQ